MALCACGCGGETKTKWVRGHHSRVNNISQRPDIREKRRQQMKEWHDSGKWKPWNKGVSDERTKSSIETMIATRGDSWRKSVSQARLRGVMEGKIVPVSGVRHGSWKGGTSKLIHRLRGSHQLYKLWKYPILIRDGFKCQNCRAAGKLEVHHDKERMCDIMKSFIPDPTKEMSFEEEGKVLDKVVQYHVEAKVSGIALCKKCHKEGHDHN